MKLGTHVDSGQMYHVYWNQAAAAYLSLYFFIFLSLQFSNIKIFRHFFSGTVRPRRLKLGTHMDSGQMYSIYQNQAAAAYLSPYFFIFLSLQFSNIKIFVTLFSGTVRPRNLLHTYSGQMYHVYQNQAAAAYSSFYFFIFLSNFLKLKIFVHTFLIKCEAWKVELGTYVDSGLVSHLLESGCSCLFISFFISSLFFLSNFLRLNFFVTFVSGTMRPGRLILSTHMDNGQMYRIYRNQAAAAYSSLYFFVFLSNFQTLKFFVTIFSGSVWSGRLILGRQVDSGQMYRVY